MLGVCVRNQLELVDVCGPCVFRWPGKRRLWDRTCHFARQCSFCGLGHWWGIAPSASNATNANAPQAPLKSGAATGAGSSHSIRDDATAAQLDRLAGAEDVAAEGCCSPVSSDMRAAARFFHPAMVPLDKTAQERLDTETAVEAFCLMPNFTQVTQSVSIWGHWHITPHPPMCELITRM